MIGDIPCKLELFSTFADGASIGGVTSHRIMDMHALCAKKRMVDPRSYESRCLREVNKWGTYPEATFG